MKCSSINKFWSKNSKISTVNKNKDKNNYKNKNNFNLLKNIDNG